MDNDKTQNSQPTCSTCRCFYEDESCRRHSPLVVAYQHYEREVVQGTYTYEADHFATIKTVWPKVLKDDWCGDHIPWEE